MLLLLRTQILEKPCSGRKRTNGKGQLVGSNGWGVLMMPVLEYAWVAMIWAFRGGGGEGQSSSSSEELLITPSKCNKGQVGD